MLMSFAALHNIGIPLDWSRMYPDGNFVRLPRYFWKNDRFLTEPAFFRPIREGKSEHVFLGRRPIDVRSVWETELSMEKLPYLTDHCIQENIVFPAAGYIEMFYAATFALYGKGAFRMEQMQIEKAIFLKQDEDTKVRVIIDEENNTFRIHSLDQNDTHGSVVHVRGEFRAMRNTEKFPEIDLKAIKARLGDERDAGEIYPALRKLGYTYGPAFQGLRSIRISDHEILSQIELPDSATEDTYLLHPSLLDACFQTVIVSELNSPQTEGGGIRLPVFVESIRLEPGAGRKIWCYARLSKKTPCEIASDIYIFDSAERMLGSIKGFTARNVNEVVGEVKAAIIDKWLYELVWEKEEVAEATGMENNAQKNLTVSAKSDAPNSGIWVVFADQGGTGHELALRLRSQGDICWTVVTGDYFDLDRERFEASLIPDLPDHINHLFSELNVHSGSQCKGIVHLWNLDSPELEEASLSDMHRSKRFGSHSVINIAKSLSANSGAAKFWIVTRNTQPVATEGSSLRVTAAPVWGIGRVLAQQELVEQWGGLIDLDRHADEQDAERIFEEITAPESEGEIVFRGDAKYLTRIRPCSQLRRLPRTRLRKDAAYLIVGAFGALGQLVAETLVRNGARRLILASRSSLPDRDKWQDMVSDADTRVKIEFVKYLERMGAAIHLAKIDISREAEVKAYLDEFRWKGFPPIRGVFFCAGIVKDTLLGNLDSRTFDIVYDTKVMGAYILHKYFSHEPLEHFVLFSSVAAQITTAGQINYSAGNAFLDCLAHHRRMLGLSALSINWGPWATGMIKALNLIEHYKTRRGMNCILPAVGMDIMNRILDLDQPQFIVCDANWSVVLDWYPRPPALFSGLASLGGSTTMETKTDFKTVFGMTLPEERGYLVDQKVLEIISQVLRCKPSQVESHQSLSQLGVDSILATELRNKISNSFGQMVPIVKLLSGVTIVELAGELTEKLNETTPDVASMSESAAAANRPNIQAKNTEFLVADGNPKNGRVIDEFPLSFGQKAIWFIHQMNPESPAYNIGGAMHIPARLDIAALERALNEIVRRHASLRMNFFLKDGEPYQRIYECREVELKIQDVSGLAWEEICALIVRDNNKPFDLEKEALFRLRLYRQSEESYYFAVSIFHIISDAWSNYRFIDEMQRLYAEYTMGIPADLPEIQQNYSSFVEWENRLVNSARGSAMYNYWANNLPAEIHPLDLKTDKPRPSVQTNNGASITFAVNKQLTSEMKELSKATGCTMFVLFLSLYHILLHKYTQQEDIIIGSPVAGRTKPEFANIYGYFVNPLPFRANFKNDPVFIDFVQQVRQTVLMGLDNQDYPFSLLVDRLGVEHDASRSSVFQVLFVLLNHRVEQTGMDEANVAYYKGFPMQFLQVPEEEGQFDITLSMYEENGAYQAILKYNSDLFVESTIRRMAEHFLMLTAAVVKEPNDRISDLQMLTAREIEQIINNWRGESNETVPAYDVQKIIEENAIQRPNSIAVTLVSEDGASDDLTYCELNARANQLAAILRRNQGNSNSTVGVYMEKSLEMVIVVLAILKAGRAFVPLDPGYPPDRITHMLADSGAKQICSLSGLAKSLPETGAELILLDEIKDELLGESAMDAEESAAPESIAYLIYTSGTTGIPKGVRVTRRNLYATYKAWESAYDLRAEPGAHLQMAGFSFDVFCGDYVRALCSGEKLVLCPKNVLLNIPLLYRVMREQGIRRAEFVPSIIRNLMAYLEKVGQKVDFMRLLIVGSDIWTVGELRRLKSLCGDDTRVINSYGLTEATIDSTYFEGDVSEYEDGAIVPIGKPFPGTEIYILDANMNPVPLGIPGEICIGGQGVAAGYNNDPELTARRFVEWVPPGASKAVRIYKTGDIAQWDAKGIVQLRQRLDKQVKMRGYRVELQEIEKVMDSHSGVLKSLVRVYGKSAENQKLLAYYLANPNSEVHSAQLLTYLSHKLPGFMTPSWITEVPEFPLSMNGKVDPEKLPVPSADGADEEYLAPETMYEKKIAKIWQRMLGVANPGLRHDFFQLGGNSLHLIELMIHIQNSFKIQITVNQLLRQSSLRGMATIVEDIVTGKVEGSEPYTIYNPGRSNIVHCFPPAGGYSIVYKTLAENLDCASLISYNYLMDNHKIRKYTEFIKSNQARGPYTLFGYSLGGNMAYEIACELERMGETVSSVIMMDSYRITESFKPSESDLRLFEEEFRAHFKKYTGYSEVQEHTLKQARSYIDFCYDKMNRKNVQAEVHFIIENSPENIHADYRRKSWDGSSNNGTFVYSGMSRHAEMLDENYAPAHAEIIRSILNVDESKEGILTECAL
jgi:hybrid polyketide synthase/nonribosomal peptide synthetase FtdB